MVWTASLSSKGQLVLPKAVRERLGAGPGTKIVLVEREGRIELRAHGGDILRWYGARKAEPAQDFAAVKEQVGRARAAEVVRESKSG